MNSRRGSTLSPIRMRNSSSAPETSSIRTCNSVRLVGIERGVAQLFGVHFAQAFEAGDRQAAFAGRADGRQQAAQVLDADLVFAAAQNVARFFAAGALLAE